MEQPEIETADQTQATAASRSVRLAIWTIVAHAVFSTLHGAAHQSLGVKLSPLQTFFVAVVITIAPILAGILLWKGVIKIGAILLACSMTGALIFGVYNHFVAISPDHVSHLEIKAITNWVWIFQVTAILIAVIEAFGIWVAIRTLKGSQDLGGA